MPASRYRPANAGRMNVIAPYVPRLRRAALLGVRFVVEVAVFSGGPVFRPVRRGLAGLMRRRLETITAHLDPALYLAQFTRPARRTRASRDPALHYAVIGCRELKTPCAAFDPVYYRRVAAGAARPADLFQHAVSQTAAVRRWNECDEERLLRIGEFARGQAGAESAPALLTLTHPRGGGSNHLLSLHEARARQAGMRPFRLRPLHAAPRLVVVEDMSRPEPAGRAVVFHLDHDKAALVAWARGHGVCRLVVNHVIDQPSSIFTEVPKLAAAMGCPFDVLLHDYYAICPRVDMIDGTGRFCDGPGDAICRRCVAADGSQAGDDIDPAIWRDMFHGMLKLAECVYCPSADHAARLRPWLLGVELQVSEPEAEGAVVARPRRHIGPGEPLRIAVLGALNVPKGLRVVAALAETASRHKRPLHIDVIGPSANAASLGRLGVQVHGPYLQQDLGARIAAVDPHVIFIPAIWPETWSFTLTHALATGRDVVCFDIGAPAERLRRLGRGRIWPLALAEQPDRLLDAFMDLRETMAAEPVEEQGS